MEEGIKNLAFMNVQIISIGNELLIGDTINTNASWMGQFMTELGFEVKKVLTISDSLNDIKTAISSAISESDVVLCTGGLGPTHDDMTKKAVADLFGVGMRLDQQVLDYIKASFEKRKLPFSKSNYEQAEVPENCEVLFNKMGTAPGMWFPQSGKYLAVMPGVPYEMQFLMKKQVLPRLQEAFKGVGTLYSRYIKTAGIGESTLSDEVLGDMSVLLINGVSLAFLPTPGGVTLRLNGHGSSLEDAKASVSSLAGFIYRKASNYIIGEGKELTLAEVLGNILKEKQFTIATAESCTGGLIADKLTDIPGSSDYMLGGIVSYSNQVKVNQLGVAESDLKAVGAVSKEVALQMAKGVAKKMNADIGISTTGVAGPGGGTKEKPVGTVWIGYWSKTEHFALKAQLTKDRILNKERSMRIALETARRNLLGITEMPYNLEKQLP